MAALIQREVYLTLIDATPCGLCMGTEWTVRVLISVNEYAHDEWLRIEVGVMMPATAALSFRDDTREGLALLPRIPQDPTMVVTVQ